MKVYKVYVTTCKGCPACHVQPNGKMLCLQENKEIDKDWGCYIPGWCQLPDFFLDDSIK